jgi:hypothetical protein
MKKYLKKIKPNLSDITICAVDCITPNFALFALKKSLDECDFGRAILFTDQDIRVLNQNIELIQIKNIYSVNEYSRFILKELHQYIKTKFILIVQWDGYVLDGKKWNNTFYNYDYIGARWSWHRDNYKVGNGGFSLRSLKLHKIIARREFPYIENLAEDMQLCKFYRDKLSNKYKIKFAPDMLADEFSYEKKYTHTKTFGFHGFFNFYKHLHDKDLEYSVNFLDKRIFNTKDFRELLIHYFFAKKINSFFILHKKFFISANFKYLIKFYFHFGKRIILQIFSAHFFYKQ